MTSSLKARLIQGAFICPITDNPSYLRLKSEEDFRSDISEWLMQAGFQLNETSQGGAFFSGARHLNPNEDAPEIRAQFKEAYEDSAFTTFFLNLIRSARDANVEFKSGELLRSDEIFQGLMASETHQARLRMLWSKLVKKNKELNNHEMLIACLDELSEHGYLACEDKKLGNYRICGKIEHLFDMLEYAIEHAPKNQEEIEEQSADAIGGHIAMMGNAASGNEPPSEASHG